MDLYSVILKDDIAVDPRTYGALLAPALGVTVLEARMAVRRGSGIFAENLPEDDARRLAEALEADGIGCWCAPSAALPPPPQPRRVTRIEATEEGLQCTLLGQSEPVALPWSQVGVVSIGLVLLPELQEEIAGVRKKDVAAVARREQEQRDLVRDRLLAFLARIDLSHEENAPPAAAHHYFFDQLRRREAKQLKAFIDLVSTDGAQWWRLPLEESSFTADSGPDAPNYQAAPVLFERRPEAHTERSRKVLQGGNVERLTFHTMEEYNRYTRWWTWRERLRVEPELALPTRVPASGGNGHAPHPVVHAPDSPAEATPRPGRKWRAWALVGVLIVVMFLALGFKVEVRGTDCIVCRMKRQDHVVRIWGRPLRETLGEWKKTGPSPYDEIIGTDHDHLYTGFGYKRDGLLGVGSGYGRSLDGNASPEEADAVEAANWLFAWFDDRKLTAEEVKEAYPRVRERVRSTADSAARKKWIEVASTDVKKLLEDIRK